MTVLDTGTVRADELYTLDGLKLRLDLTDTSYRKLRDAGLPEIQRGKRKYFLGKHVIAWFAGEWTGPAVLAPDADDD